MLDIPRLVTKIVIADAHGVLTDSVKRYFRLSMGYAVETKKFSFKAIAPDDVNILLVPPVRSIGQEVDSLT
jgi:hypothetical protein